MVIKIGIIKSKLKKKFITGLAEPNFLIWQIISSIKMIVELIELKLVELIEFFYWVNRILSVNKF